MILIPWRPRDLWWDRFNDLEKVQSEINRLFDRTRWPAGREQGSPEGAWSPAIDVYDGKEELLVKADIPGMKKEDIEVVVEDKALVIKGEKKPEQSDEKGRVRTERFYGTFYRSISLPGEVDTGRVGANYRNGVLEIILPRKEEYKPKQIKIDIRQS